MRDGTKRPLALVTLRPGAETRPQHLKDWLGARVPRWSLPERWAVVDAIARTGVGKYDKKALRRQFHAGDLPVTELPR